MKPLLKLTLLFATLAWCSPGWATLTCTDGAAACTSTTTHTCAVNGTSCTITFTTTAGRALTLTFQTGSSTVTFSSASDGGFTCPAGSRGTGTAGASQVCYVLSSGGVASIVCTFSASNAANQCELLQFSYTLPPLVFDTSNNGNNTACTSTPSTCPGVALTLGTANNYLLIQSNSDAGTTSAIDQSYSITTFNGSGAAYKINVTVAGTTPLWTSTLASHDMVVSGLAIYETPAAAGTSGISKWRKLEQLGAL